MLTASAFLLLIYVFWQVRAIGELVLISAFLALALNPLVTLLERKIGNRRGVASVIVVLGVMVLVMALAIFLPMWSMMDLFKG